MPSAFNKNVPHQRDETNIEKRIFGFVQCLVSHKFIWESAFVKCEVDASDAID